MADKTPTKTVRKIRNDAKGQFAGKQSGGGNNGVASAKPRVITGSDDATSNKWPPGHQAAKDWDINVNRQEPDAEE